MSMSDCKSVDDILTEFAKRDPAGYIVWGQKLLVAHNRECEQLNTEIEAMSKFNDALNAQMKELAVECERLRALVKEMADELTMTKQKICARCPASLCSLADEMCEIVKYTNPLIAKCRAIAGEGETHGEQ